MGESRFEITGLHPVGGGGGGTDGLPHKNDGDDHQKL